MTSPDHPSASAVLRQLAPSVYLPTLLQAAGVTSLLPVVPLLALQLGFTVPQAAALTMIAGVGAVLGPIPVSRLMIAVGARRALIVSGVVMSIGNVVALVVIGAGLTGDPSTLHRAALIGILVLFSATSQVWSLGRQSYLGSVLPPRLRARGMTTFGGMIRVGQVIGPLLGAGVLALGHDAWVFALFAGLMALATLMVTVFMPPGEDTARPGREGNGSEAEHATTSAVAADPEAAEAVGETVAEESASAAEVDVAGDEADHAEAATSEVARDEAAPDPEQTPRAILTRMMRVGIGVTPIMMGRVNRPVIVPLLGAALGVDAASISLVFAIAAVLEIVLFIPAGVIMDRFGRAAVAVPCSVLMGAGYLLLTILAATVGSSPHAGMVALLVPTLIIAVGNGLGAGIVMTLGIDVSPEHARTRYLGWWNTVIGVGRLASPLMVTLVTMVAPVAAASTVCGVLGLLGGAWLLRELPRSIGRI